ncbi:MAG: ComEC/Rec2 family competence protein [Nitrospinota bacterium]
MAAAGVIIVWSILYIFYLPDGNLRVTFCDVGQGDGIYIDLPDGKDVLIDGGPGRAVLECIGERMPFWDRKIEVVDLTHPQADHLGGLVEVLRRYEVGVFVSGPIGNETKGYKELVEAVRERNVQVKNVYAGDDIKMKITNRRNQIVNKFQIPNFKLQTRSKLSIINYQLPKEISFRILWPSRKYIAGNVTGKSLQNQTHVRPKLKREKYGLQERAEGEILQNDTYVREELKRENVLGLSTEHSDLNDFSLVLEVKFGEFEVLLTGDADEEIQDEIMAASDVDSVEIFKVPHHGSKYGILDEFLEKSKPVFAVVSVGKNRWGHPSPEVIRRLGDRRIRVLRTDRNGDVTIVSNGKQYWVESDRK